MKIKEKAKEFWEKHCDTITFGTLGVCTGLLVVGINYYSGWCGGMNCMGDKLVTSLLVVAKLNPDMTLTEFLTKYTK